MPQLDETFAAADPFRTMLPKANREALKWQPQEDEALARCAAALEALPPASVARVLGRLQARSAK